jgi:hypothetical protein
VSERIASAVGELANGDPRAGDNLRTAKEGNGKKEIILESGVFGVGGSLF